ncbi:UDP-glycosyltransferase 73C4-like [Cajanus cajan]|uniref:UDP-glycosyltransferase 73C4-like n=1 Tax=Cajanus cajan TaxID=3821 RepID=UPI00098DA4B2|nr:UDP-glycosyltransferase 73C4-like [Cajanus cajan]
MLAMETTPTCNLHFVFIPFMAPGHMLPLVDMAKLMARRNVKVTIVTTPLNALKFSATIHREIQSGSPIQIQLVSFPNAEAGIPEGCESLESLPSMDLVVNFMIALSMLQKQLEELIEKMQPFPCCIVSDKYISCVADIAIKFKVPRIVFDGTNCINLLCNHNLHAFKVYESVSDSDKFVFPGLPHRIEMRKSQLPKLFKPGPNQKFNALRERAQVAEAEAYGIVVNSFEELEAEYVKEYQRVTGRKVWCIGPVSLSNEDALDKAQRGSKRNTKDGEVDCVKWLDSWPERSVIYVCLGSLNRVAPKQLMEIGLGLEATKRPFIWVLRGAYRSDEMERWLLEERFEERVKERGVLVRGWVPQMLILSHGAIGAFFTHCGWNSSLEAICVGVPLVTFPIFHDQFFNEKLAAQVAEIGVSVGAESAVHLGQEDNFGECVRAKRDNVKEAIEKVMGEGEEKEERRGRARKYGDMAKKTMEKGGSSYCNMSMLIEDISQVQLLNQS